MSTQTMLLVTYAMDGDADRAACEERMRRLRLGEAARALLPVSAASSWRIREAKLGSAPYGCFECIFLAGGGAEPLGGAVRELAARAGTSHAQEGVEILSATLVAPPGDDRTTGHMLFLPHSPREGAVAEGFEEWLAAVDSPVINALPGVVNYSGWRVDEASGGARRFTNFDLIYVDGPDGFDRVYGDPDMLAHEQRWIELWGAAPGAPIAANFPVLVAERLAGEDGARTPRDAAAASRGRG